MKDELSRIKGATPVDDVSGLLARHITTKQELDSWEAENILKAVKKYLTKKRKITFGDAFIRKLHAEMFSDTWEWAGRYRSSDYNIGVPFYKIGEEISKLAGDFEYWKKSSADLFENALRVHHRLVKIHPFANGNGRHARLAADIILFNGGLEPMKWPDREMIENSEIRKDYIESLKHADKGDYGPLFEFASRFKA